MKDFIKFWKTHRFKIFVYVSVLVILVCWYVDDASPGTMSTTIDMSGVSLTVPKKPRIVRHSKGENECRIFLETYFKKPFPNQRVLRNPITNANMELDCYNEELKLACEYNGVQHYKYVKKMHPTRTHFNNQKYRDELKRTLCNEQGIDLIVVPYTVTDIPQFLQEKLEQLGYAKQSEHS